MVAAAFCASPGKGMEFVYQLPKPNAMRKPSVLQDQTQTQSGSICWVKQSLVVFFFKAFFIVGCPISFGSTLVLLSGKKAPEIIQTAPLKMFCRCQHIVESRIQHSQDMVI